MYRNLASFLVEFVMDRNVSQILILQIKSVSAESCGCENNTPIILGREHSSLHLFSRTTLHSCIDGRTKTAVKRKGMVGIS